MQNPLPFYLRPRFALVHLRRRLPDFRQQPAGARNVLPAPDAASLLQAKGAQPAPANPVSQVFV